MLDGVPEITGAVLSTTVTVNDVELLFDATSVNV
jgi:hypothetical protein